MSVSMVKLNLKFTAVYSSENLKKNWGNVRCQSGKNKNIGLNAPPNFIDCLLFPMRFESILYYSAV